MDSEIPGVHHEFVLGDGAGFYCSGLGHSTLHVQGWNLRLFAIGQSSHAPGKHADFPLPNQSDGGHAWKHGSSPPARTRMAKSKFVESFT